MFSVFYNETVNNIHRIRWVIIEMINIQISYVYLFKVDSQMASRQLKHCGRTYIKDHSVLHPAADGECSQIRQTDGGSMSHLCRRNEIISVDRLTHRPRAESHFIINIDPSAEKTSAVGSEFTLRNAETLEDKTTSKLFLRYFVQIKNDWNDEETFNRNILNDLIQEQTVLNLM